MVIRYSHRHPACRILGIGLRAVLWVQGCCFSCEGCIADAYRNGEGIETTSEEMAAWYLSCTEVEGLTISGGEPMLQAAALADMLDRIRQERPLNVTVYTGFVLEELRRREASDQGIQRLLEMTDILIDGPYVQALDDGAPYIGSSNQRLHIFNPALEDRARAYYGGKTGRCIELHLDQNATYLIGVPSAEQRRIWQNMKKLGGKGS